MNDTYKPYQLFEKSLAFEFEPTRFEIWSQGKLINEGKISGKICCSPLFTDDGCSKFETYNFPSYIGLTDKFLLDLTFTGNDRIYITTVPRITNINDYNSFISFKTFVPIGFPIITREVKHFEIDEPYVCSLFTVQSKIIKMSFSFGINPRLLELYSDQVEENPKKIQIAQVIISLLIEDCDMDGAWISERSVISEVKNKFEFIPSENELLNAIQFINLNFSKTKPVVIRATNDFGFSSSIVYKSDLEVEDLELILSQLK